MQGTIKTIYGGSIMRTIEDKIIDALNGCNGEGVKNLSCRDRVEVDGKIKKYYLWNSLLFWNDAKNIYYFSARGWNSLTTKSRLNAILGSFFNAGINQKNWGWFLNWNGKKYPVDSDSIFMLKDNKLYRLGAHEEEVKPL